MSSKRAFASVRAALTAALGLGSTGCGAFAALGPIDAGELPDEAGTLTAPSDGSLDGVVAPEAGAPEATTHFGCLDPVSVIVAGVDTGYDTMGARACMRGYGGSCCGNGRPFVVDGVLRLAPRTAREDWRATASPETRMLPVAVRAELARRWAEIGRMEHASVAAFARFVLQLLALGAPHDLIADAQRAIADEATHARLAFGLASAYGGQAIGPGPIDVDGCLDDMSVASFVIGTFVEGCVGETMAAIEALETLDHARDPAVRQVLETIARDEMRHAELAWRTVAWALEALGDAARHALAVALVRADQNIAPEAPACADSGHAWLDHGIVTDALRSQIRQATLSEVVGPLATALLARTNRASVMTA